MTYNNNNQVTRSGDLEQIDFIDLILQLWRGKWLIAAFIAIAIAIAAVYLVFVQEKWSSSSIITQPDTAQIGTYSTALNIVYGGTVPPLQDIQSNVFNRYNAAFSALAGTLENKEEPETLTIEQVVKGQAMPLRVGYVGDSAEGAQKQLALYIQQIDEQIGKELYSDLRENIEQQVATLKNSLENQEEIAQEQKDLRIKQLSESLKYAQAAGVTKPQIQQTQDVTQDSMFLLGTDALSVMVEREASRPLTFGGDYYAKKQRLLDIDKLQLDAKSIHAYRYVMKPDLPIRRDSPKRAIVLILSVLLGGLIGSGVVLGRNAMRNYQRKA